MPNYFRARGSSVGTVDAQSVTIDASSSSTGALPLATPRRPLKEGWLVVQRSGLLRTRSTWRPRWVALYSGRIDLYLRPREAVAALPQVLALSNVSAVCRVPNERRRFCLQIDARGAGRITLQASSDTEYDDWYGVLLIAFPATPSFPLSGIDRDSAAVHEHALLKQSRHMLQMIDRHRREAQQAVTDLLRVPRTTFRSAHLRTLNEIVGPRHPTRSWEDEWPKLRAEHRSLTIAPRGDEPLPEPETVAVMEERFTDAISGMIERGWSREDARTYAILSACRNALGRALRDAATRNERGRAPTDSRKEESYTSSLHALNNALLRTHRTHRNRAYSDSDPRASRQPSSRQQSARSFDNTDSLRSMVSSMSQPAMISSRTESFPSVVVPPRLYFHRVGPYSLTEAEPAWRELETPDAHGFCGLQSLAMTRALREPLLFSVGGFSYRVRGAEPQRGFSWVQGDHTRVRFSDNQVGTAFDGR